MDKGGRDGRISKVQKEVVARYSVHTHTHTLSLTKPSNGWVTRRRATIRVCCGKKKPCHLSAPIQNRLDLAVQRRERGRVRAGPVCRIIVLPSLLLFLKSQGGGRVSCVCMPERQTPCFSNPRRPRKNKSLWFFFLVIDSLLI